MAVFSLSDFHSLHSYLLAPYFKAADSTITSNLMVQKHHVIWTFKMSRNNNRANEINES